jgi:hypothetical protein
MLNNGTDKAADRQTMMNCLLHSADLSNPVRTQTAKAV